VICILGINFMVWPLLIQLRPDVFGLSNRLLIEWTGGGTIAMIAIGIWARQTVTSTLFNRRLFATATFFFILQCLAGLAATNAGLDPKLTLLALQFTWGAISSMVAITLDHRLAGTAIGFIAGFVASSFLLDEQLYVVAVTCLVFTINALWRERIGLLEERATSRDAARAAQLPPEAGESSRTTMGDSGSRP
jgi:hypothetical protein